MVGLAAVALDTEHQWYVSLFKQSHKKYSSFLDHGSGGTSCTPPEACKETMIQVIIAVSSVCGGICLICILCVVISACIKRYKNRKNPSMQSSTQHIVIADTKT